VLRFGLIPSGFALVFDLDGVIIDSMPMHAEAWRIYLQRHGATVDDMDARMHGRRNDDIVGEFIGGELTPAQIVEARRFACDWTPKRSKEPADPGAPGNADEGVAR